MKNATKSLKNLALTLAMLILFQGCTVYKKANVTMQESVKEQVKTKVQTVNGNLFFKYVIFEDGTYYGIKKRKGELERTRLDAQFIKSIHLKNKTLSTILTIFIPVGTIVVAAFIFQDAFKWDNSSSNDGGYWF